MTDAMREVLGRSHVAGRGRAGRARRMGAGVMPKVERRQLTRREWVAITSERPGVRRALQPKKRGKEDPWK